MSNSPSPSSSNGKESLLFMHKLGRRYFLKQIFQRFVFQYMSRQAAQYIAQGLPQLAVFAFDHIGERINIRGIHEREELTTLFGWLEANNLIHGDALDIGANIGNHSLFFSKYYGDVMSFEPNYRTFKLLEFNAELVGNIKCFNVGLSDSDTKATLTTSAANVGAAHLTAATNYQLNSQSIQLRTLDSFPDICLRQIGLIKIDVEGHELSVLKGGKKLIEKNRPIILFEQHPSDFKDGHSPVIEYLKTLEYAKFASVMPAPAIGLHIPSFVRSPLLFISRAMFGLSYRIVQHETLPPNFYAFIIAIP